MMASIWLVLVTPLAAAPVTRFLRFLEAQWHSIRPTVTIINKLPLRIAVWYFTRVHQNAQDIANQSESREEVEYDCFYDSAESHVFVHTHRRHREL
jgi:hypothetical protein